ncbi:hypothetical protein [Cardinium endosymbiont of Oedothorax gibbosus]|uniref:hypothetical protein n=1 Tax=Cardinium endosymbiont of Oedothorax gibbosus TaxID=931101 RepID=UPI002023EC33|nr:hypothetical protein [Cardinium endosymbiont of Oedothorax gibbosus]CAH2559748.1 hypothetical protein CAOEGIBSW744_0214 [Cardinium endosymbiont of Oedothorax gibbosus]
MRSCSAKTSTQDAQKESFIACVGKQYLYPSDISSIDLSHIDAADADFFIKKYVEEWACKQLLIAQANHQAIPLSMEDRFNDYKHDLLAYHFLETLIESEFDANVSSKEIADYYQKYKQRDFILHHDIVRGIFLAIPKKAVCINAVKSLMLSNKASDRKKLQACCKPYARTTILETNQWFPWEAVLAKIGYHPPGDATRLLKTNKFIHVAGQKHIYFLKINQYKLAQDIAPLKAVEDRIRAIILHKRKLDLINKIKCKLLEDAKKNRTCIIQMD